MALVASENDLDIFASSWQAKISGSQCLTKSLRKYDIETVDVINICEKLSSALNENTQSNHEWGLRIEDGKSQCSAEKSNIPFRAFSNIWFSTLKIYQHQVNTLFRLSEELCSRSRSHYMQHLGASKRKSSLTSHKLVKKRRITLCESNEKIYSTSFSDLLDDLEKLARDNTQNTLEELPPPITQLRMREITIREISATIHTPPDIIDDEDSGFGEATHEEILEFFNFVGDNSTFNAKRTPTKRKSICGQESPTKLICADGLLFQPLNNENVPMCENTSKSSPLERSITPKSFDKNNKMENIYISQENNDLLQTDEIKKENFPISESTETTNLPAAKKKRKLIIDECIKIDMMEIIEEIKTSKLSVQAFERKKVKTYKSKRNISAFELLTRFNRRSRKLTLSLKQKFYLSREQFERDFLNILREIFKTEYKEKLASETYPKWTCFKDELLNRNKKQGKIKKRKQEKFAIQPENDINYLSETLGTNISANNNYNEYHEIPSESNDNNKAALNTYIHRNWRPYGVMFKLLNLWRFNQTNKVAATTLFKLAQSQIDRALGFSSLLNLSKEQFVNLRSFPKSIELQSIFIGKSAKCEATDNCI